MPVGGGKGGGGGKDVRGGGAFFELFARDNLSGVLDKMKAKARAFAGFMGSVGRAAGIAGASLAVPLTALFKGGVDRAADVAKMSQQFGVPIELMSRLQYAAEQAGVSVEEVMKDTEGRFSALVNSAPTISTERGKEALELQREMGKATDTLQQAMLPLLKTVVPIARQFSEFVDRNKEYLPIAAGIAATLLAIAAAVKVGAVAFAILGPVASAAWAAMTGPVGIGVGLGLLLGGGLFAGLAYLTDEMRMLKSAFKEVGAVATETFSGIGDALKKGDITLALKIALAGFKVFWAEVVRESTVAWVGFKMVFVDAWHEIVLGVRMIWNSFFAWVEGAFNGILRAFLRMGAHAAKAVGGDRLAAGMNQLADNLRGADELDIAARRENDGLLAQHIADRDARNRERLLSVIEARKDVDDAKAELAKLTGEAAMPGVATGPGWWSRLAPPPKLAAGLIAAESVKGGFSNSALQQQFGISDQATKQTELQKQIAAATGLTATVVKDLVVALTVR